MALTADVAFLILREVAKIRKVSAGITETDRQALRLFKRVTAIEHPMLAIQQGINRSSSTLSCQLLATVEETRRFLKEYTRTGTISRALKRKASTKKFTQLGVMLIQGSQAVQLDVAVDAWAKEDALDRLDDLEYIMDIIERMERNRVGDHRDVMLALKMSVEDKGE